jgi:hypothetical protein
MEKGQPLQARFAVLLKRFSGEFHLSIAKFAAEFQSPRRVRHPELPIFGSVEKNLA